MKYQPVKIYTDARQIITFQKHSNTVKRVIKKKKLMIGGKWVVLIKLHWYIIVEICTKKA
jgi:hypothetical protein